MKLLLAARRFPPDVRSGTETVFEALYARARRRHEVRLVCGYRHDRALVPAEASAVDLRGLGRARSWMRMRAAMHEAVASFRPDVVLSNSIEVPVGAVPTAVIVHDLNFGGTGKGLLAAGRRAFYKRQAQDLAAVIAVSEATAHSLVALGVDRARLRVVRNGVDTAVFHPAPGRRAAPPFRLVYPGRILPGKAQHLAIDAVARLPVALKGSVELVLVGAVADPRYLERLRTLAVGQPVSFAVDVPDIVPYYQDADIVLFPSMMDEGFGFTAVEGMACGVPVIWFDQPGVREATGGNGVPVRQGDVAALRDAIAGLLGDAALRQRLGEDGRRYVEGNLGWDRVWERYEAILGALA